MTPVYVSTTGNDTTGNGTITLPYATIGKALTVVTNPGGTIYVRGGTYTLSTNVHLTSMSYITIASYTGELAILDGNHTVDGIIILDYCVSCTIQGLQIQNSLNVSPLYGGVKLFQSQNNNIIANYINNCFNAVYMTFSSWCTISGNKITNCTASGLSLGSGSNNNTIDSNLIDTIATVGTGTGGGGVFLAGGSGNKITHNQIQNCGGGAVVISAFDATSYCFGNIVQYNYCQNICNDATNATDCGAIYVYNASLMLNNIVLIDGNFVTISSGNSSTNQTVGVYLDNYTSGCTITNNILQLGQKGIEIHGGMNNTFKNNIIDMETYVSSSNCAGLFQGLSGFTGGSMTNNIVSGNIIYSSATTAPATVWQTLSSAVATISSNFYYNTHGQSMGNYTAGGLHDSSPITANPDFLNPAAWVYDMGSNSTCVMDGFLPVNQGIIGLAPKTAHFY